MTSGPGQPKDSLADWLLIRTEISWPSWRGACPAPGATARDGFQNFFTATRGGRDSEGTARVLTALDVAVADAEQGRPLTFALMAKWQRTVLGRDLAGFRTVPAFAKGGRERYGLAPDTRARFERCLSESAQPDLPLPSRAARAHLDILFFHPFEDGNARAAMLALAFVLAREGVFLNEAYPLQTTRWADDPEGAVDLAVLLGILINAADRRLSHGEPAMNERDILTDELAQGIRRPVSEGIERFDGLGQEEQSEVLLFRGSPSPTCGAANASARAAAITGGTDGLPPEASTPHP
ncbi:Fic family protein [Streptomyces sp. NPDC056400]|uniref:Fic family protein n=1 Tax=Streptomyces sp. NPDC056400 TaxID=3345808 RepID=UPI0035DA3CBB